MSKLCCWITWFSLVWFLLSGFTIELVSLHKSPSASQHNCQRSIRIAGRNDFILSHSGPLRQFIPFCIFCVVCNINIISLGGSGQWGEESSAQELQKCLAGGWWGAMPALQQNWECSSTAISSHFASQLNPKADGRSLESEVISVLTALGPHCLAYVDKTQNTTTKNNNKTPRAPYP